jgi:hypothetical protein
LKYYKNLTRLHLFRELFSSSGACAATKRGMEALLGKPGGVVSVLVVGGAPESLNRYFKGSAKNGVIGQTLGKPSDGTIRTILTCS